jgi:hypothetical protein
MLDAASRNTQLSSRAMLEDALLDLTDRGGIVIDPFLGSSSTLIAAEKTGRVRRGVELDPLYVDVIVRRYQAATGNSAVLAESGDRFVDLAKQRLREQTGTRDGGDTQVNAAAEADIIANDLAKDK